MFWSPTGGGVRRYVQAKQAWLGQQAGWRHTIAVPRLAGTPVLPSTLPSIALPGSAGYRLPLRRAAMARVLASLAPSLIEAADPYRVAWAARDAAQALAIPAVAYCHSNIEQMAHLAGGRPFGAAAAGAARRYARNVYAGFDLVLAPSRDMLGRLRGWGIDNAACQPLGVDSSTFAPSRADPAWRARHGFDPATRLLVYVGRFAAEKHLDVLADAVGRLGPPYALALVGAGPIVPPQGGRVSVLPFVSGRRELAAVLASADVFVHAGDQETFGLSLLEAMACGTPAVVGSAGALHELVDARTGAVASACTGAAFAEAIASLFECDRSALSLAARRRGVDGDWNRVLPDLLGHYRRLLGLAEAEAPAPGLLAVGGPVAAAARPAPERIR